MKSKKSIILKINQNALIFGFFLLLSFIFWFFNALSNEYNAEIVIPVEFIQSADNKLVPEARSNELKIKFTATGYKIVNYKTTSFEPVVVNLNQYEPKQIQGFKNKRFYILTQQIKDLVANSIGPNLRVNIIYPDSLYFIADEFVTKKVPVRKNFDLTFKKQFILKKEIVIQPDSVIVRGIKSTLDTLSDIYTVYNNFKDLDGAHVFEMDLMKIPGIEFGINKISCTVEAEEFTEQNFELPIEVINVPENIKIKVFPDKAKLFVNVGFSRYRSIYKDQFRLVVDFKEAGESQVSRLRIKVAKSPENISALRIFPQSVEYIIERND